MRYIYQGTFKDGGGNIVKDGTISIFEAGTSTTVNVYTAASGGNSVTTVSSGSDGHFVFYIDEADYAANQLFDITLSKANFITKTYNNIQVFPFKYSAVQTIANLDATPSVKGGDTFKTANAGATTIITFDDGYDGQKITVLIDDANTTIDFTGTTLKGNGGGDWSPAANDSMECVYDGTNWYCNISDNSA